MKIVNLQELIFDAQKRKIAIPQFNINNLEWTRCILSTCAEAGSPVVLGVTSSAVQHMGGYHTVSGMVNGLIYDLRVDVPVVLHLDHARTFSACEEALYAGFTSLMVSTDHYDKISEKINFVNEVSKLRKNFDITIESELGSFDNDTKIDIESCIKFTSETDIDLFAPAVGSMHGMKRNFIDFDFLKSLNDIISVPLVLHGGSALSDSIIRESICLGCRKININTENMVIWAKAVRKYLLKNPEAYNPRKIINSGFEDMKKNVSHRISIIYGKE